MKGMFSTGITSTFAFILSLLAVIVIAVSAPGMAQAANFGSLTDNGTAAYMGIGIAVPVGPLHVYSTTSTQPETIDLSGAGPLTAQWNNWGPGGASSGTGFLARFSRGTKVSPVDVVVGDRLGFNVFGGMAGGIFKHTAAIEAVVGSGTVSGTSLPTYMRFLTTPNGSTARVERMRIDSAGRVGINTVAASDNWSQLYVVNDNTTDYAGAIYGETKSGQTAGVAGKHRTADYLGALGGPAWGAMGQNNNNTNLGQLGTSDWGVWGKGAGASQGVRGESDTGVGVYGKSGSSTYGELGTGLQGVYGYHNSTNNYGYLADASYGVYGLGTGAHTGVYGQSSSSDGVRGDSTSGTGVHGTGGTGTGVFGNGANSGVTGTTTSGYGVYGSSTTGGYGVYGSSTGGEAGHFQGRAIITDNLSIGTSSAPNSTLQVAGSLSTAYTYIISSSYTALKTDSIIAVSAPPTSTTITLPTAAGITGRYYTIKSLSANTVNINTTSSQTIDGSSAALVFTTAWKYVTVVSNGSNWLIVANN